MTTRFGTGLPTRTYEISGLVDQTKVMASIAAVDAATAHRVLIEAKTLAERLTEGRFEAPIRIDTSRRLVEFVSVRNDEIQIAVRMDAVVGLEVDKARSEPVPINVPVYLKRCGLGVRLIVPGRSGHPDRSPDAKLVALCVVVTTGSIDLHPDAETAWPRSLEKRRSPGRT